MSSVPLYLLLLSASVTTMIHALVVPFSISVDIWGMIAQTPIVPTTITGNSFRSGLDSEPSEESFEGWYDPRLRGGRFLDYTTKKYGEPLNIVISGHSDPSLGYSAECLGLHYGNIHTADLGDGQGRQDELFLARQHYRLPKWGTCFESLAGGQHFRAWKQNGTMANSGAWFIGASKEFDSSKHHEIVPDGYNLGRDWFVGRAIQGTRWKGMWWGADVEWRTDLLEEGSEGINHGIAQDGRVAILTIKRL